MLQQVQCPKMATDARTQPPHTENCRNVHGTSAGAKTWLSCRCLLLLRRCSTSYQNYTITLSSRRHRNTTNDIRIVRSSSVRRSFEPMSLVVGRRFDVVNSPCTRRPQFKCYFWREKHDHCFSASLTQDDDNGSAILTPDDHSFSATLKTRQLKF